MKTLRPPAANPNRARGFTLTELLTVMGIVAILMAIGVPSFRSVTTSNRIAGEINGLLGDMQFARLEAVKQGFPVTVCVSSDSATCTGGSAWRSGWIVFTDPNGSGTVDTGDNVLRVQKPFTGSDTFNASNNVSKVIFNREGFATGIVNGTVLTLHDSTGNTTFTRCLSVTLIGSMTTLTYDGSTCS